MQAVLGKFFTVEYYMDRIAVNKQLYDRMVDEIRKKRESVALHFHL